MMYGTVARMKVLPGKEREFLDMGGRLRPPGLVFEHVYKLDSGHDDYMMVVGFESKEAYRKNAESPEMHQSYLEYRRLLAADPEWHDGEIVGSLP